MTSNKGYKIHFETRVEIRPDLAVVETFHDGSQLIRKNGYMIIVESSKPCFSQYKMYANLHSFSDN